jgi:putative hemolysin
MRPTKAPKGNYTTITGLVVAVLGRIPAAPGDRIKLDDYTIEVTSVSRHAVTGMLLRPRTAD